MSRITQVLADTTSKVLFREAKITAVTTHGECFRSIELAGDPLKKASWTLGDKVQIRTDPAGLTTRTYTPVLWDNARGATALFAYAHGTGPGSAWVRGATVGDVCQLSGPRRSLKLDDLAGSTLFVGDETSFALLRAWRDHNSEVEPLAALFEVTDPGESGLALDALGLPAARLFTRMENTAHLEQLSAAVVHLLHLHPDASLCLTGQAQTIARLRRELKAAGLTGRRTRVKAYWDEQRRGLD